MNALAEPEGKVGQVSLTATQRLERMAAELEPERAPFWVDHPDRKTPAQGWWWVPKGGAAPMLLGHNSIVAAIALQQMVDAGYAPR